MSLRINNNSAAVNAHRNLQANDARMGKTLERLSSGNKINRGADGPAALVISEQMRAQVAGLTQATMNSESAVSLVQTAEANLNEVSQLLVNMRQLAIHAANEGVNDNIMLEADQAELANSLDSIDRISEAAQFGTMKLLDGSHGVSGMASGEGLHFETASTKTQPSPQSGYAVVVDQEATQARVTGSAVLTQELINAGEVLTFQDDHQTVQVKTEMGQNLEEVQNKINEVFDRQGMKLDAFFEVDGRLTVMAEDYGSATGFGVTSTSQGVLSGRGDIPTWIENGIDIHGTIGGEVAMGSGQTLTGAEGTNVEDLQVRFTGNADPLKPEVGRIGLQSNALTFQVGGNHNQTVKVFIPSSNSGVLGEGVNNESNYKSLRELDLRSFQGAQDALLLIDKAIDDVTSTRAGLGAVQKNTLESNINSLNIAKENLINAESVIRDTDMAAEMSEFTRHQIMTQSATAMLAQANQAPNNILSLLK